MDLSTFNTNKLTTIKYLFQECNNLSYIDISTFPDSLNYDKYIFDYVNNSGTIKVNKNISKIITKILNDELNMNWVIIDN